MKPSLKVLVVMLLMTVSFSPLFASGQQDASGAESDEKVSLVFWAYETMVGEDSALEEAVKDFEMENPNIEVSVVPVQYGSSSFRDKFITAYQAGAGPDVIVGDMAWGPELAAMEAIRPVEDLVSGNDLDAYFSGPLSTLSYNGMIHGLPLYTNTVAMYINKTAFMDAGLDVPSTDWNNTWDWADFRTAMETLTTDGKYGFGLMAGWGGTYEFFPFLWSNGGAVLNSDNSEFVMDDAAGMEAADFFLDLINDGLVPEAAKTWKKWDELHAAFTTGLISAYVCGDWGLNAVAGMDPDFEWGLVPIPVAKQPASMVGGANLMINSNTENAEAAYKLISYLTGDETVFDLMESFKRVAARKGALEEQESVSSNPNMSVLVAGLEHAQARPMVPFWTSIDWNCLQPAFLKVYLEGTSLEDAIAEARVNIEEILAE